MKITDYRIIKEESPLRLEEKVVAAIGFGWQPQGGVSNCLLTNSLGEQRYYFYQAMIKIEQPTSKVDFEPD